jgi:hypothetical protein
MKFKLYSKFDSSKEAITIITSGTLQDAIDKAAQIKNLPLDKFNELFGLKKINQNGKQF